MQVYWTPKADANTMVTHMTPDDASVSSEVDCLHLCSAEESCFKPVLASFFSAEHKIRYFGKHRVVDSHDVHSL